MCCGNFLRRTFALITMFSPRNAMPRHREAPHLSAVWSTFYVHSKPSTKSAARRSDMCLGSFMQRTLALAAMGFLLIVPTAVNAQHPMGWQWPTGSDFHSQISSCGSWLGRDSANGGCYISGYYHIGIDILVPRDTGVFAIANGTVTHVSSNGWGTGNVGLVIRHRVEDGSEFMAVYGHVYNRLKNVGDSVSAGERVASIGPYSPPHLHFGIRPGSTMPGSGWGLLPNSQWPSTNGFVDPVAWLHAHRPFGWATPPGAPSLSPALDTFFPMGSSPVLRADRTGGTDPQDTRFWMSNGWVRDWSSSDTWTVSGLPSGAYTWWAKKRNAAGEGPDNWSRFHINFPPHLPTPQSPVNDVWLTARSVTMSWNDPGDPDNQPNNWRDYRVEIARDGGDWSATVGWGHLPTTWSVTLPSDGRFQWRVAAGDGWNNQGFSGFASFRVDSLAPVTTLTLEPAVPNGTNGWYVTAPVATLTSTDPSPGSGVASRWYTVNGGSASQYTAPVTLNVLGEVVFGYYARDVAGNQETARQASFKIDTTPPPVPSVVDEGESTSSDSTLSVLIASGTDPESGVSAIEYAVGDAFDPIKFRAVTRVETKYPHALIDGLTLPHGTVVYVYVRSVNGAGLVSPWGQSDGIFVDPQAWPHRQRNHLFGAAGAFASHPDVGLLAALGEAFIGRSSHADVELAAGFIHSVRRLGAVSGTVDLQGVVTPVGAPVSIQVRELGSGTVVGSYDVLLAQGGAFTFATQLVGDFHLSLKSPTHLRRTSGPFSISPSGATGLAFSLINGDVNGDNTVNLQDFLVLRAAFGSSQGSQHWNPNADLNRSGTVDVQDFLILRVNFGRSGDS